MRIPTIIALVLILLLIGGVVALSYYRDKDLGVGNSSTAPQDIQVVNVTDSQVTIIWQTATPTLGVVLYGEKGSNLDKKQPDDRTTSQEKSLTHFATLSSLTASSTYQFKVISGDNVLAGEPHEFKTSSQASTNDSKILSLKQPLQGSVVEPPQKTLDEGLVVLKISGASPLATFITGGNFILPLKELRKQDLGGFYNLTPKTPASLVIQKGSKASVIQIILPIDTPLPTITLGQNLDLSEYLSSPSANPSNLSI